MKKKAVLLCLFMMVAFICGCGHQTQTSNNYETKTSITSTQALEKAKYLCQNACFNKASCSRGYFRYGTEDVTMDTDGDWDVSLKGRFYPEDAYGDLSKYTYLITYSVSIHTDGSYYVIYENISKEY